MKINKVLKIKNTIRLRIVDKMMTIVKYNMKITTIIITLRKIRKIITRVKKNKRIIKVN